MPLRACQRQQLLYDGAERHGEARFTAGATVRYVRDTPTGGVSTTYDVASFVYDDPCLHVLDDRAARYGGVARSAPSSATSRSKPCRNSHTYPVEGGSCNAYDYVCGDPVNGFDLNGLKQRDLPEDLEARGGDCHYSVPYAQLAGPYCSHYRAAVWEDDSSIFYDYVEKGIDYYAPQTPRRNAVLGAIDDFFRPTLVHGEHLTGIASAVYDCGKNGRIYVASGFYLGASLGSAVPAIGPGWGGLGGAVIGGVAGCSIGFFTPPSP